MNPPKKYHKQQKDVNFTQKTKAKKSTKLGVNIGLGPDRTEAD